MGVKSKALNVNFQYFNFLCVLSTENAVYFFRILCMNYEIRMQINHEFNLWIF